jgi:hypothetical protein
MVCVGGVGILPWLVMFVDIAFMLHHCIEEPLSEISFRLPILRTLAVNVNKTYVPRTSDFSSALRIEPTTQAHWRNYTNSTNCPPKANHSSHKQVTENIYGKRPSFFCFKQSTDQGTRHSSKIAHVSGLHLSEQMETSQESSFISLDTIHARANTA